MLYPSFDHKYFDKHIDPDNVIEANNIHASYFLDTELESKFKNDKSLFSMIHINIRSIKANFVSLKRYLDNCKFNIIAVSETWLFDGIDLADFEIDGYKLYCMHRQSRGGGVASMSQIIFIRKSCW